MEHQLENYLLSDHPCLGSVRLRKKDVFSVGEERKVLWVKAY